MPEEFISWASPSLLCRRDAAEHARQQTPRIRHLKRPRMPGADSGYAGPPPGRSAEGSIAQPNIVLTKSSGVLADHELLVQALLSDFHVEAVGLAELLVVPEFPQSRRRGSPGFRSRSADCKDCWRSSCRPWICSALTLNVPPCQPNARCVSRLKNICVKPSYAAPRLTPPVALPSASLVSRRSSEIPKRLNLRRIPQASPSSVSRREIPRMKPPFVVSSGLVKGFGAEARWLPGPARRTSYPQADHAYVGLQRRPGVIVAPPAHKVETPGVPLSSDRRLPRVRKAYRRRRALVTAE